VVPGPNDSQWLVVTNTVDDPANLQIPWVTSVHFKKEPDGAKWDPTPCSATF
jgi:transglutaminase/protease-like cytokinesis protein 3